MAEQVAARVDGFLYLLAHDLSGVQYIASVVTWGLVGLLLMAMQ